MSAVATTPSRALSHAAPTVSFGRLLKVEARKLVDTRSGFWLLIATGVVTLLVAAMNVFLPAYAFTNVAELAGQRIGLVGSTQGVASVLALFLTVLGILTVTSEWGQRTVLTTFVLEPRRYRVLGAKVAVVSAVTVLATAFSFAVAAVLMAIAGAVFGVGLDWTLAPGPVAGTFLGTLIGVLMWVSFALMLLNAPAAIVAYVLLPMVLGVTSMISVAWPAFSQVNAWINPAAAQASLMGWTMDAAAWAHLGLTSLIWIGIPLAVGLRRWGHREAA
jgi:hypothetical protein